MKITADKKAAKGTQALKGNKDTNPIEFYSYIQEGNFKKINKYINYRN